MGMLQDMMNQGGAQSQGGPEQAGPSQGNPNSSGVDVATLTKQAIQLLYDKNFEGLVQMFQQHGKDGFPQAMSAAINGVLGRLEKEYGPLDPETAAQVGVALFEALLEDLAEGGALPDIDKQSVLMAIEKTLRDWVKSHPDRASPEEMKQMLGQMAQQMGVSGQVMTPSEQVTMGGAQSQQAAQGRQPQEM